MPVDFFCRNQVNLKFLEPTTGSNLTGNLSGGEVNLAYELLNIQQSIDGLMSILSLFIIHVALVHVRIE